MSANLYPNSLLATSKAEIHGEYKSVNTRKVIAELIVKFTGLDDISILSAIVRPVRDTELIIPIVEITISFPIRPDNRTTTIRLDEKPNGLNIG